MAIKTESGLLLYREDLYNLLRLLSAPVIFAYAVYSGEMVVVLVVWFLLNDINFLLHQHVHMALTRSKLLNRYIDLTAGVVTGMSAANWHLQHIHAHHKEDGSEIGAATAWEFERKTWLRMWVHCFRTTPLIYLQTIGRAFYRGFVKKRSDLPYKTYFFEQVIISAICVVICFINPVFIAWYALVGLITKQVDYVNHVGPGPARFLTNTNINPAYNFVRDNFGYHNAHHYAPSAHWTELPTIHNQLVSDGKEFNVVNGFRAWPGTANIMMLSSLIWFRK